MAARKTKLNNFQSGKELQKWSDRDNAWNHLECKCDATTPAPLTRPIECPPVGGRASGVPLYIYIISKWHFWGTKNFL